MNENNEHIRSIKSFVLRGRANALQNNAIKKLWSRYGLNIKDHSIDYQKVFHRQAPRVLEIGFGDGNSFYQMAQQNANKDFIGVEVYRPGIAKLLLNLQKFAIENVRIFYADAIEVLQKSIPDKSLAEILLFFPDPWPKRAHHKRRILNRNFITLISKKLDKSGYLQMITDWEDYAKEAEKIIIDYGSFTKDAVRYKITSKFSQKAKINNRDIYYLAYRKKGGY